MQKSWDFYLLLVCLLTWSGLYSRNDWLWTHAWQPEEVNRANWEAVLILRREDCVGGEDSELFCQAKQKKEYKNWTNCFSAIHWIWKTFRPLFCSVSCCWIHLKRIKWSFLSTRLHCNNNMFFSAKEFKKNPNSNLLKYSDLLLWPSKRCSGASCLLKTFPRLHLNQVPIWFQN